MASGIAVGDVTEMRPTKAVEAAATREFSNDENHLAASGLLGWLSALSPLTDLGCDPDHNFVVGDGFTLVFIDQKDSFTPYRVCWHRLHHSHHRCWFGETGRAGSKDRIFTAAPSSVGTYIIKWTVNHRRKALWVFHNGVGD